MTITVCIHKYTHMHAYTLLDFIADGLDDTSIVTFTQLLCGTQVITGHLHLLLLKRHHGILQEQKTMFFIL